MKFRVWVTTDAGTNEDHSGQLQRTTEQLYIIPRWIALDEDGYPERVCGPSGLQYSEFVLEVE